MFVINKTTPKTFDFRIEGTKKTYKVPLLDQLPMEYIKKAGMLQGGSDDDAFEYVNDLFEKYAPGVIDSLNAEQYKALVEGYFEQSAVSLGE